MQVVVEMGKCLKAFDPDMTGMIEAKKLVEVGDCMHCVATMRKQAELSHIRTALILTAPYLIAVTTPGSLYSVSIVL